MINYNYGDIILVQFPFSNIFSTKQRPAVIISNNYFNKSKSDIIIMAITSNPANQSDGDSVIYDWAAAGLVKRSYIKPAITTLENKLVIKKLGNLTVDDSENMKISLKKLLNLSLLSDKKNLVGDLEKTSHLVNFVDCKQTRINHVQKYKIFR